MVNPKSLRTALFAAAILSRIRGLDWRLRSAVISDILPFALDSPAKTIDALKMALLGRDPESVALKHVPSKKIEEAEAKAGNWLSRGVFLISLSSITAPDAGVHDLPPVFFAWGEPSVLKRPAAAILNSRLPRRVASGDFWLEATKTLFRAVSEKRQAVASSYGNLPYCVVSRMACLEGLPLIMVCDDVLPFMGSDEQRRQFLARFGDLYRPDRTLLLSPFPPGCMPDPVIRLRERDNLVVALSSVVMVAHARRGGNMEAMLKIAAKREVAITACVSESPKVRTTSGTGLMRDESAPKRGVHVSVRDPEAQQPQRVPSRAPSRQEDRVLRLKNWPEKGTCLIHYTRSCPGPWPGQSYGDYCQSLIDGREEAVHSGFHTLRRILEEGVIRGSERLTRGKRAVVSLTECLPGELIRLIKWRKGLIRWSFEPYGIAVARDILLELGARPVIYGDETTFRNLPEDGKFLFQPHSSEGKDWSVEQEWRIQGDLDLKNLRFQDITVIVDTLDEAWPIQDQFGRDVTLAGLSGSGTGAGRLDRNRAW